MQSGNTYVHAFAYTVTLQAFITDKINVNSRTTNRQILMPDGRNCQPVGRVNPITPNV